jgi:hypothetical protein
MPRTNEDHRIELRGGHGIIFPFILQGCYYSNALGRACNAEITGEQRLSISLVDNIPTFTVLRNNWND